MAVNKSPWIRNLSGAPALIFPGKVQAGSTKEIKRGEICCYDETAGYFVPVDAVADRRYSLAIANEEQKAADLARYIEFLALRPDDVFEFAIDAPAQIELGDGFELTANDSQKLTRDIDGDAVAFAVGRDNYPEIGTTIGSRTYVQVSFNPVYSYWEQRVLKNDLKKVIVATGNLALKVEDNGAIVTNKGASGAVTITAPEGVVPVGWHVNIVCMAAQALAFDPKPDTANVYIKGAAGGVGKYASVTDEGDFMEFVWDGTDWLCIASISGADGDITVES